VYPPYAFQDAGETFSTIQGFVVDEKPYKIILFTIGGPFSSQYKKGPLPH